MLNKFNDMILDKKKSLLELENIGWKGNVPSKDDSYVIRNSYKLYHKNLHELSVEDIRFLIGQKIGLRFIMPLAIDILREDLFAEGDYYEGDLLKNVLNVDSSYWSINIELKDNLIELCNSNMWKMDELDIAEEIKKNILDLFKDFKS